MPSQFSEEFAQMMRDRMAVSFAKYGDIRDAYPHKVDALESADQRLQEYQKTGNTEFLVDAANFLMIEFMLPRHPRAHFRATGSHESPGRTTLGGDRTDLDNRNLEQGPS
jgi:hypothetical protein